MMTNQTPHIVLTYPASFPQELIDKEISKIANDKLLIHIEKKENETYAAMEWIIPTFLATYVLKPYFEAFLSEMGKDHYTLLKENCKKMVAAGKQVDAKIVASSDSPKKLSNNYTQSIATSIIVETKNGRNVKLLFDNNLTLEDWNNAVDEFFKYVSDHYDFFPADKLSEEISKLDQRPWRGIYVVINPETKKLEFFDDTLLLSKV